MKLKEFLQMDMTVPEAYTLRVIDTTTSKVSQIVTAKWDEYRKEGKLDAYNAYDVVAFECSRGETAIFVYKGAA